MKSKPFDFCKQIFENLSRHRFLKFEFYGLTGTGTRVQVRAAGTRAAGDGYNEFFPKKM
jgi:hypothetical protein